eukprot:COSAG01_NODE_822_length_13306_cov_4.866132_11_plen_119_part_00
MTKEDALDMAKLELSIFTMLDMPKLVALGERHHTGSRRCGGADGNAPIRSRGCHGFGLHIHCRHDRCHLAPRCCRAAATEPDALVHATFEPMTEKFCVYGHGSKLLFNRGLVTQLELQ